ncbi:hypothetical protein P7K49_007403, partial [Saguinus oedipus]
GSLEYLKEKVRERRWVSSRVSLPVEARSTHLDQEREDRVGERYLGLAPEVAELPV